MRPPFEITDSLVALVAEISALLGRYEGWHSPPPRPQLRRRNRIRSIAGSLGIEGNTLTEEQITAILDGKRVIGEQREIQEVHNAIAVYDLAEQLNVSSARDFLRAHAVMLKGLDPRAGRWRSGNVGVLHGSKVAHVAPGARRVPELMKGLFAFIRRDRKTHALIKSCICHYEIEFIHPFRDGNGRMGRLWQHLFLVQHHEAFRFTPIESVVRAHQHDYYRALKTSDQAGESTAFVEFSLATVRDALHELLENVGPTRADANTRLERAAHEFGKDWFARRDYMRVLGNVSSATASRDLKRGIQSKILIARGQHARTRYRFG